MYLDLTVSRVCSTRKSLVAVKDSRLTVALGSNSSVNEAVENEANRQVSTIMKQKNDK